MMNNQSLNRMRTAIGSAITRTRTPLKSLTMTSVQGLRWVGKNLVALGQWIYKVTKQATTYLLTLVGVIKRGVIVWFKKQQALAPHRRNQIKMGANALGTQIAAGSKIALQKISEAKVRTRQSLNTASIRASNVAKTLRVKSLAGLKSLGNQLYAAGKWVYRLIKEGPVNILKLVGRLITKTVRGTLKTTVQLLDSFNEGLIVPDVQEARAKYQRKKWGSKDPSRVNAAADKLIARRTKAAHFATKVEIASAVPVATDAVLKSVGINIIGLLTNKKNNRDSEGSK